jgi:DNA-binding transcriptional regulator YiaG
MPNIAVLLRNEISRLSRRGVRKEVQPLRKLLATHRREIAALKRTIATLDRRAKLLTKAVSRQNRESGVPEERPTRFVAKGLVSLRKRLGVSAADLARLLGVSMQSVYNWEHKKATPRKEQVEAIAALRSIGKKEAEQRLAGAKKTQQPRRKTRTPRKRSTRS